MKPLALYMEDGRIICEFTVFVSAPGCDECAMRALIKEGLCRMAGIYSVEGKAAEVAVKVNFAQKFSFGAVNVKVIDRVPVDRRWFSLRYNVSREYIGTRRKGIFKLMRFVYRMPDVFINLAGRDAAKPVQRQMICSVVQHEFGHVLGFRDQYRQRGLSKRKPGIADGDIMYRTGKAQNFMGYHIKRLRSYAQKGRLPFYSA